MNELPPEFDPEKQVEIIFQMEAAIFEQFDEITRLKSALSDKGLDIMWDQLKSREVEIGELKCDICDRDAEQQANAETAEKLERLQVKIQKTLQYINSRTSASDWQHVYSMLDGQ